MEIRDQVHSGQCSNVTRDGEQGAGGDWEGGFDQYSFSKKELH